MTLAGMASDRPPGEVDEYGDTNKCEVYDEGEDYDGEGYDDDYAYDEGEEEEYDEEYGEDEETRDTADPEVALNAPLAAFQKLDQSFKQQQVLSKLGQEPKKKAKKEAGGDKKKVEQEVIEQLEGKWIQEADGAFMGEIINGEVIWDTNYQHKPSKLTLAKGVEGPCASADIELELNGERHWGRYEGGPEPKILWSDGEVWIRSGETSKASK